MALVRGQRVLLESAARTATTTTSQVSATVASHARWLLNVTAASGSGGLTFQLRGYDKASGSAYVLLADGAPITATGLYSFEIGISPDAARGNRRAVMSTFLPVVWDVNIAHGDATSYTYSLSEESTG